MAKNEILGHLDVLASIRPRFCANIFNLEKTEEIRKTKPNLPTPFKVLVYCTKPDPRRNTRCGSSIVINDDELYLMPGKGNFVCNGIPVDLKYGWSGELMTAPLDDYSADNFLCGKVIGEFICDEITEHVWCDIETPLNPIYEPYFRKAFYTPDVSEEASCLTSREIEAYGNGKTLYSWHIRDPILYEKPRPLTDFLKPCVIPEQLNCSCCEHGCEVVSEEKANLCRLSGVCDSTWICKNNVTRAPQSWCYVNHHKQFGG